MTTPLPSAPAAPASDATPFAQLPTNRSLGKYIGLSIITLGIYAIIVWYEMTESLNTAARRDGRKTMNYLLMILLSLVTFGIYQFVWMHQFSERVGNESQRRGLGRQVEAKDFWLWYVLGSMIIVGPFIYQHKVFVAMNQISGSYNQHGA
ncbi:MAG: DUF4234 domain-containing protein [Promicromonosporaceae bacterium]|nr:DUF4234 domain-containing protein [Promicromonosporaceae bacterium]